MARSTLCVMRDLCRRKCGIVYGIVYRPCGRSTPHDQSPRNKVTKQSHTLRRGHLREHKWRSQRTKHPRGQGIKLTSLFVTQCTPIVVVSPAAGTDLASTCKHVRTLPAAAAQSAPEMMPGHRRVAQTSWSQKCVPAAGTYAK